MGETMRPSRFAAEVAVLLDDNVRVPVEAALAFERALAESPSDAATRAAYRDWLTDNDCPTRAAQLGAGVLDQTPGVYEGLVRPEHATYQADWAAMCGVGQEGASQDWADGFNTAMRTVAFWLDFQAGVGRREGMPRVSPGSLGMRKSALLGRLMRGEELRRRPCPRHKGVMWCSYGFDALRCACEGTGWLANDYQGPLPEPEG